jgi:hypothetical protein
MQYVSNSWIMDVAAITEADSEADSYFYFQNTYGCEVRECWAQGIPPLHAGSGQGYGVYLVSPNSDALVEDNIFVNNQIANNIAGGGSGCVFGYNYCVGTINTDAPWYMSADLDTHGGEPAVNLFEGCVCDGLSFDNTWGGDAFDTAFRCWLTGHGGEAPAHGYGTNNQIPIDLEDNSYSPNIIGNVLGDPNKQDQQDSEISSEPQNTMFSEGNYSFRNGSVDKSVSLPPSLYYTSKPFWWGRLPWPAIGPDTNPKNGTIPAQQRYDSNVL